MPFGRKERLSAYLDSQRQIRILDSMYKACIERWLAASHFVALPEPSPFPVEGLFPPAVTLFDGILEGVCRGRWKVCREYKYIPLSVHSPLHMGVDQQTPAWVVTNLGIFGEDVPSKQTRLGPGLAIHLHDNLLAQMNLQFEKPWLFGTLENMIWREPGYHILVMKPHLFTITQRPFVVPYLHTYIAIPTQFIHDQGQLQIIYSPTLGQRQVGEELLPPLRPWGG
jgi:hypothetical protein